MSFIANSQWLIQNFFSVMWIMSRTGSMLMTAPVVGTHAVPKRLRVLIALILSMTISPLISIDAVFNLFDEKLVLVLIQEIILGSCLGFLLRLCFEAGALAGELISQSTGLSFAQMNDPLRGTVSGIVSQLFYLIFSLLFFTNDRHLALISLLNESYNLIPIGTPALNLSISFNEIISFFLLTLKTGVTLAIPIILSMMSINICMGTLAKAAPALNPIQLGLPLTLLLGIVFLTLLIFSYGTPILHFFDITLISARTMILHSQ